MSRTADQVQRNLLAIGPQGWAWAPGQDSTTAKVLRPLAQSLADFEASAEAQLTEINPRAAAMLLVDYERVLGPDPCLRDLAGLGTDDRQRLAYQRWTARGGQSVGFFVALAASLDIALTITEQVTAECGISVCGDDLAVNPEQFIWLVKLPTSRLIEAECGAIECGMALGDFVPSLAECVIREFAPAHTRPVFAYTAGI